MTERAGGWGDDFIVMGGLTQSLKGVSDKGRGEMVCRREAGCSEGGAKVERGCRPLLKSGGGVRQRRNAAVELKQKDVEKQEEEEEEEERARRSGAGPSPLSCVWSRSLGGGRGGDG